MTTRKTPLFFACQHLARQVLTDSGGLSTDVMETLAGRYNEIAETHQDYVRKQRDTDDVIEHAVRYLADVHVNPGRGTDLVWFREALNVLIELAVPNTGLTAEAVKLLPCIQEGVSSALADEPVPREQTRISDEDAVTLKRMTDAGREHGVASELLDLLERLYHGEALDEDARRFMMLAAMAAPITRQARTGT